MVQINDGRSAAIIEYRAHSGQAQPSLTALGVAVDQVERMRRRFEPDSPACVQQELARLENPISIPRSVVAIENVLLGRPTGVRQTPGVHSPAMFGDVAAQELDLQDGNM